MKEERSTRTAKPAGKVAARGMQMASLGIAGFILLGCASGCAIHYGNSRTGTEHLWGLGQLRLETQAVGTNGPWATVASGHRVSGLCLEIGRDRFGFVLGYLDRQRLSVVSAAELSQLEPPTAVPAWLAPRDANARWAFGHLRMRTTGSSGRHAAIVTGKALAGLGAGVGGGDTSFSLALDSRQLAVVQDENIHLELDQDAPHWPGFDLFAVKASATDLNQPKEEP